MTRLSPARWLARLSLVALALSVGVQAQPADSVLAPVEVSAAPYALEPARAPVSIAVRTRSDVERASDPALTADALGRGLPGVWISDRGNASTGERVLVRGLGWRAAFGVRGTHVVLDGVPLTLPDGQTPLNVLDPALVTRVELVRGPASTFWGSGSAGVLALSTASSTTENRVRALGGAYGLAKGEASARVASKDRQLAVWGSALRQDGYRDHSAVEVIRGGASGQAKVGNGTLGLVALGAWMPRAEAPGGITVEAFLEDPRQTRPIVLERDASKRVAQGDLALSYSHPFDALRLRATLSGGFRALRNPIVPRYIDLDRRTLGLRTVLEGGDELAWGVGVEAEAQRDDRLETSNDGGQPGSEVLTDQLETVRAGAAFGRLALRLTSTVTATAALRADVLRYRADPDNDVANARIIAAASPSVGLSVLLSHATGSTTLYANASGALDAPTTTELGNRTDGLAGFNPDLRPERTWGGEAGLRTVRQLGDGTVGLDAAAFVAVARDLLLPFEVGEVTATRNEGEARHAGVELAVSAHDVELASGRLDAAFATTFAQGTFLAGPDGSATPEGNRVPGFPPRLITWTATWTGFGLALGLDGESASGYAADSAGELQTDPYVVAHVRVAVPDLAVGAVSFTPFVSLRNVGDVRYAGSVVVNPFGGRFVEPAPGRHVIAGLAATF
ncbi:MAG: TonB-dependent receptor [Rubricoccaceae bacterium]